MFGRKEQILKRTAFILVLLSFFVQLCLATHLRAADSKFTIGVKAGVNKLEGDWKYPRFNPMGALVISYAPMPYFGIGLEANYSSFMTKELVPDLQEVKDPADPTGLTAASVPDDFKTTAFPIELDFKFNFAPRKLVNPFATLGFGGINWEATYDGNTILRDGNVEQKNFDLLFKTSGGLEFVLENGLGFVIGADFRFTGSDVIDQRNTGDLNDGITSVWGGVSYAFKKKDPLDLDGDHITKRLDLDLYRPEDINGYADHDGKPEGGKPSKPAKAPIVIHYPIFLAEAGVDLEIEAAIASEIPIRVAAVIYRTTGTKKWNLVKLKKAADGDYKAVIKGSAVTAAGLEYCVVAVDTDMKGIGNSGLPNRPIQVKVDSNARSWRIVSGLVAFFGWGAATYVVMRKQNTN